MKTLFDNREDAGHALVRRLARFTDERDVLVLAMPRGGVHVGVEVARALRIPLQVWQVGQFAPVEGKTVILIDDGVATGATIRAAILAVRQLNPKRVIVAVPVTPLHMVWELRAEVDEFVTILAPARFFTIDEWYKDFPPVTDEQIYQLLDAVAEPAVTS